MSAELLSSKVVILEEEPQVRGIPAVSTAVAGAVGVTERGPIGQATLVTTWEEYVRRFGGFVAGQDLPLAALGFFQNGGRQLWVVRTCHYQDVDEPATVTAATARATLLSAPTPSPAEVIGAPLPLELAPGVQLVVAEGGTAPVAIAFEAEPAAARATLAGPFALPEGAEFEVSTLGELPEVYVVDAGDFVDVGAATPSELALALGDAFDAVTARVDADGHLVLESGARGAGAVLHVRDGAVATALGLPTAPVAGSGNVADISAVTLDDVRQLVEAHHPGLRVTQAPSGALRLATGAVGPSARLQVVPPTDPAFGLDTALHTGSAGVVTGLLRVEATSPGAWANRLTVEVTPGRPGTFDLVVKEGSLLREAFRDLVMDPSADGYVGSILHDRARGSSLVRVVDFGLPEGAPPAGQIRRLEGGDDGINGLDDLDFVGSPIGQTGLHALDPVSDLSLLLVPGRASPTVHADVLRYCEVDRRGLVFGLLDPPAGLTATEMLGYQTQAAALDGLTEHGAIYWPRLVVPNPDKRVLGAEAGVVAAPSGAIAGIIARTDASRPGGVYEPPAGVEVGRFRGVIGLETEEVLEEIKRDLLYPRRVNPLNRAEGGGWYVDGVRTLKGGGNFPTIAERRGLSFIERSLRAGLQFARHRNNDDALAAQVFRTIKAFLLDQMNVGAFASREPDKAFFVEVSRDEAQRVRGELHVVVGVATQRPAEFVVIRISQTAGLAAAAE
jgi:uncharacterized protein